MTPAGRGLLHGRRALVLGLDDIGAGIAQRFAREGARVAVAHGDDGTRAQRLAKDLSGACALTIAGGLNDAHGIASTVARAVATLDGLDVLVCNLLPCSRPCALEQLDDPAVDEAFGAVRATMAAMRSALAALRESGHGRIVLVGHRYGEGINEALGAYNAAAWSLVGLARTAAVEWGQFQITTNVLVPLARTDEYGAAHGRRPALLDRLVEQLPLRRVGDPVEDIGGAATMLASEAMCFVNGEVVHADGGQHVAGPVLNPARFA